MMQVSHVSFCVVVVVVVFVAVLYLDELYE
jgi:hypothetical protein